MCTSVSLSRAAHDEKATFAERIVFGILMPRKKRPFRFEF